MLIYNILTLIKIIDEDKFYSRQVKVRFLVTRLCVAGSQ